jgi:hypothetical protein
MCWSVLPLPWQLRNRRTALTPPSGCLTKHCQSEDWSASLATFLNPTSHKRKSDTIKSFGIFRRRIFLMFRVNHGTVNIE